jgi:hypothetical protein
MVQGTTAAGGGRGGEGRGGEWHRKQMRCVPAIACWAGLVEAGAGLLGSCSAATTAQSLPHKLMASSLALAKTVSCPDSQPSWPSWPSWPRGEVKKKKSQVVTEFRAVLLVGASRRRAIPVSITFEQSCVWLALGLAVGQFDSTRLRQHQHCKSVIKRTTTLPQ